MRGGGGGGMGLRYGCLGAGAGLMMMRGEFGGRCCGRG